MVYILIILTVLIGSITTIFKKNYTLRASGIKNAYTIYMLLAHPVAAVYFFMLAKGSVPLNTVTFLFAVLYSLACISGVWFNLIALDKVSLVYISIFSGAGGVVVPFLFELFFYTNIFSVFKLLSVLMRILAVLFPIILSRQKKNQMSSDGLVVCLLLFFISGLASIFSKLFANHPQALSDESFCFWTNIIIIPILSVYLLKPSALKEIAVDMRKMKPSCYLLILITTALGNISSLISINILRYISATLNAVITSSLSMILTACISVFLYKEKLTKQAIWGIILSILAILFGLSNKISVIFYRIIAVRTCTGEQHSFIKLLTYAEK